MLAPLLAELGARKVRELTADDVAHALAVMARTYSTSSVARGHLALKRTLRYAQARRLVLVNVAELVDTPAGQAGRPSKALTLDQADAVLAAAEAAGARIYGYVALSLTAGIRTEEARALSWDHVHLDLPVPAVDVWRSVRGHGDTKTRLSRRSLALPDLAVYALLALQRAEGRADGFVFATRTGRAQLGAEPGASTAPTPSPSPSQTTAPSSPVGTTFKVTDPGASDPGQAAVNRTDSAVYDVTATNVQDGAAVPSGLGPAGNYVAVTFIVMPISGTDIEDANELAAATGSDGQTYQPVNNLDERYNANGTVRALSGSYTEYFGVPSGVTLKTVTWTLDPSAGPIATWTV